ncbi:MAG TPA: hypothetical protein PKY77_25255 [Phycisphaerae bacterium]|nr:hypothetical protein [Phycisphaerae bacterium]HRY71488.1 hypothetical protein [Phycisphaerae bacterium]HSA29931.1 hypothetical protein [Phycisphaerae bacterium]
MNALDLLKASLLDLHSQLAQHEVPLILGGGYGLFLKQLHLRAGNIPTLLEVEMWPEARSTSDLDLFLRAEIVIRGRASAYACGLVRDEPPAAPPVYSGALLADG